MRFMKIGFRETAGIGRNQRDITIHGERDQAGFRGHFDRVLTARQFDIEPARKILLQQGQIGFRFALLFFGDKARQRPFPATGQRDKTGAVIAQKIHPDMRFQLAGPVEMRGGNQLAEIFISLRVLGIERKPVENRPRRIAAARARDPQETAGDRLDTIGAAAIIKSHRGEQADPVAQRHCRKTSFFCCRPDCRRLHGAIQDRVGRKGAKMDEGCLDHAVRLARQSGFAYPDHAGNPNYRPFVHRLFVGSIGRSARVRLEQRFNFAFQLLRFHRRTETANHIAFPIDEKLGEIPLDARPEQSRFFRLQIFP